MNPATSSAPLRPTAVPPPTRRQFLRTAAVTATSFLIVPSHLVVRGAERSANEKLRIACIGTGGRGAANLAGVKGEQVVALCDVDLERTRAAATQWPKARVYQDFRRLFDELDRDIDAVTVSTPDHTHAVAALAAIRRGKHLYCEKPLAHSIHEIRTLVAAAREHKVMTQLGNQGHSSDSIRRFCEWVWSGALGTVHTIHAVSGARHCRIDQLGQVNDAQPVPPTLDWDLWLGPALHRPYHPMYLPGRWRAWMPFGSGAVGDWVCHVVDPSFWALDLGAPTTIRAEAKDYDPARHGDTFPPGSIITYRFPARGSRGPVKLIWYDGTETPPRPPELEDDDELPRTGAIVLGDKGGLIHGSHGAGGLRLFPDARMKAFVPPPRTLPRPRSHHDDWLRAIRTGKPAGSAFDYGGPLTELAQLGIVATKLLGQTLEWDAANQRFTSPAAANQYLRPPARPGWDLEAGS